MRARRTLTDAGLLLLSYLIAPLAVMGAVLAAARRYPFNDGSPNAEGYRIIAKVTSEHLADRWAGQCLRFGARLNLGDFCVIPSPAIEGSSHGPYPSFGGCHAACPHKPVTGRQHRAARRSYPKNGYDP